MILPGEVLEVWQRRRQPALARKARDYDKSDPPVEVYDPYGPYNGIDVV